VWSAQARLRAGYSARRQWKLRETGRDSGVKGIVAYLHVENEVDGGFNEGSLNVDIWELLLKLDTALD